jgi:hypothetical protein
MDSGVCGGLSSYDSNGYKKNCFCILINKACVAPDGKACQCPEQEAAENICECNRYFIFIDFVSAFI